MNTYSVILILASFFALENAIAIFNLNRKSPVNITFALFTLTFAISCFCMANISSSPDYETCRFWYRMNIPFGIFIPSFAFHFSLFISGRDKLAKNPVIIAILYVLPFYFIFIMLFKGYFEASFKLTSWGWDSAIDYTTRLNILFALYYSTIILSSTLLLYIWKQNTKNEFERKKITSLFIPYVSGMIAIIVNPLFFYYEKNQTVNFALNVFSICTFIFFLLGTRRAAKKFNFITLQPDSRIDVLINGLNIPAVISDTKGRIICCNNIAYAIMNRSGKKSITNTIMFDELTEIAKDSINDLIEGKQKEDVLYKYSADKSYIVSVKNITTNNTNPSGLLWIFKEDNTVNSFRTTFNITRRQMDIITLILAGYSNREISRKLDISERTVENHLFNIYNKTGIDNRIGLHNIAVKYGLIAN